MSAANLLGSKLSTRQLRLAGLVLVVFVLWTAIVRIGISEGSRKSVWVSQQFGQWPSELDSITGSSDARFSIYVSFDAVPTAPLSLGSSKVGKSVDVADAHHLTGSRFTTGKHAGHAISMSAYISSPVEAAPNNQFSLAIYSDLHGAPDELVSKTQVGTLRANGWNTLPTDTTLEPERAYWLFYNAAGSTSAVNNLTYDHVGDPVSIAVRSTKSGFMDDLTSTINRLGNVAPTTIAMLAVCALIALRSRQRALLLLAMFAVSLALELVLKRGLFAPYEQYPSGHTMRALFIAVALARLIRLPAVWLAGIALVLIFGFSVVYDGGHYPDEVVGGVLLGAGLTTLACALTPRQEAQRASIASLKAAASPRE